MDDRIRKLEHDLRLFKRFTIGVTTSLGALALVAFQQSERTKFIEIDVERINVVEKNGIRRLAIANSERMSPITFYGKEYPSSRTPGANNRAGLIYFNDEGTENGGIAWSGKRMPDGKFRASGVLTFDQYNQGEALALWYDDDNGRRRSGMIVYDQPEGSMQASLDSGVVFRAIADTAERTRRMQAYREARLRQSGGVRSYTPRLWIGKDPTKASLVTLSDPKGRPRLRLSVDSLGMARLEFLDENGKVTEQVSGN